MVKADTNIATRATDPYLQRFEKFEREAKHPSWVYPLRKAGISRFAELGFPTIKHEDWGFTNVAPIAKLPFKPVFEPGRDGLSLATVESFAFARLAAKRMVFVDGHFAPGLPDLMDVSMNAMPGRPSSMFGKP